MHYFKHTSVDVTFFSEHLRSLPGCDLGPLSETSMKVEKKSEKLIGRGGFYRRPVADTHTHKQCHILIVGSLSSDNLSTWLAREGVAFLRKQ